MLNNNSAVMVTGLYKILLPSESLGIRLLQFFIAINYYELGEKYQRQNQKEKALIYFCKSFKLKCKFYEQFDSKDLRRTFSKIGISIYLSLHTNLKTIGWFF